MDKATKTETNQQPTEEQTQVKAESEVKEPEANEKPESEEVAEQEEQKEEAKPEVNEEEKIQEIQAKLDEALKMGEKAVSLAKTVEDLTGEVEANKTVISEYETLLKSVIDGKMKNVPEEYRELIPENMGLKEKLDWLDKAESKGLFNKKEEKPELEIGKPMNVEIPKVDTAKMSASELMKMAYNTIKR